MLAMIRVNVIIKAKQTQRDSLIETINKLASHTRLEEGCYAYELYENVIDESALLIFESWESEVYLGKHLQTKHYKELMLLAHSMAEDWKVERFEY